MPGLHLCSIVFLWDFLFSSHLTFLLSGVIFAVFLSHYLFDYSSLSFPSSLCLCSNLGVSHLVMVVSKSHFLGRNTLAEGCSAITCRIIRLSLTISWEMGDSHGHSHVTTGTRPDVHTEGPEIQDFSANLHYVSFSPRTIREVYVVIATYDICQQYQFFQKENIKI